MEQNNLTINNEVLAKMAGMAALEVEGVTGLAKFASDVKTIFSTGEFLRSVKVEEINGLINLEVYIKISSESKATAVAEAVQEKVKTEVQNMTGSAINRVNVVVADVEFDDDNN